MKTLQRAFLAGVVASLFLGATAVTHRAASANGVPCRWIITSTRARGASDRQLSLKLRYARTGDSQREFPGPDSMLLVDKNDEGHHPKVALRDLRTGIERPLIDTWSFRPEWSPNGRWVACIAWRSPQRQRQLTIVNWRSTASIDIGSSLSTSDYRWSPDSKSIAVYGTDKRTGDSVLLVANPVTGRVQAIDRTSAIADFDYDWSPNARVLAYTKPTRTSEHDDVLEADLWIAEPTRKVTCRVLASNDHVEQRPIWVGTGQLAILSAPVVGGEVGAARDIVLRMKDIDDRITKASRSR